MGFPSTSRRLHVTFRVPGPHERGRFTPDAWGHLLSLRGTGILSVQDFEHVIDRALAQFDGRIALDDVRALLGGAGYDDAGAGGYGGTVH
jgi:Smg protein